MFDMAPKLRPAWIRFLDAILPRDPPLTTDIERLIHAFDPPPKPKIRTRIRDFLGVPRPPDDS